MLQRFESFKPRQLDTRKETPTYKRMEREKQIELLSVDTLAGWNEIFSLADIKEMLGDFNTYKGADNLVRWLYDLGYSYKEIQGYLEALLNSTSRQHLNLNDFKYQFKHNRVKLIDTIK